MNKKSGFKMVEVLNKDSFKLMFRIQYVKGVSSSK